MYGNCQSRGGAFSDPEDRSQLAAFPLPSFVGDRPQSLDWAFGRFTTEEYQVRGFLAPDIPNHCRRMKSFSESSTGRISRAWHIRVVFPEGRTHDGKYQLGHNVPTDISRRELAASAGVRYFRRPDDTDRQGGADARPRFFVMPETNRLALRAPEC